MGLLLPFLLHACSLLLFPVAMTARDAACDSQANDLQHLNSTGLYLPLYHPRSPCSPAPLPSDIPFSAIVAHDAARIARLTRDNNLSASLAAKGPIASDYAGGYVTRIGLGTPTTFYIVIMDTGSPFCWVQCLPCSVSCYPQRDPFFDPPKSSTYASFPCSAPQCGDLRAATNQPPRCSKSGTSCVYDVGYTDGSYSAGYLSKDTASFGLSSFPGFYFGCGQDQRGDFGVSSGLVGLARNKLSLLGQLALVLGNSFSYCLPTQYGAGGYLAIGSSNPGPHYSYTPLVSGPSNDTFYYLAFIGLSVDGRPLAVPFSAYLSLPTIIDSGATFTYLPQPVYAALSKAFAAAMGATPRAPGYPGSGIDICFKGQASNLRVPAVNMEFAGGMTLKLTARNVLYDVLSSTTCLAFKATDTRTTIGSTLQQTFNVVYDVARSRIGFAPGGCS